MVVKQVDNKVDIIYGRQNRGHNLSKLEEILLRIDRICTSCDGYFIKPTVVYSRKERDIFYRFISRNSEMFEVVHQGNATVLRVSQMYLGYRSIRMILPSLSNMEVARRVLWAAFITQIDRDYRFPYDGEYIDNIMYYVDDFSSNFGEIDGMLVTTKFRSGEVSCPYFVPKKVFDKRVGDTISSLCSMVKNDSIESESSDKYINIQSDSDILNHLVEGGFWPDSESDCHSDPRKYPLWDKEIDGYSKWNYDKSLLNEGRFPRGYKFGVYPD